MYQDKLENEFEEKKLPTGIQVLTIITFIGCAIELISQCYRTFFAKGGGSDIEKLQASISTMPKFMRQLYNERFFGAMRDIEANKQLLFIVALVAVGLCFWGALQMRQLKKQGFVFYAIGELLPFVAVVAFCGLNVFTPLLLFGLFFPAIMLLLYTIQRKHLID